MWMSMFVWCCVFTQAFGYKKIEIDEALKAEFIKAHNDLRSKVTNPQAANMQKLSWNDGLSLLSEENVKQCVMKHTPPERRKTSEFDPTGENLYERFDKNYTNLAQRVVAAWYSEIQFYHFENRTCDEGQMCGHYTQVIWAKTTKFGCAIAECDGRTKGELNGILVACGYGPGGNKRGVDGPLSPYEIGTPCSQCSDGEKCENQLCYYPEGVKPHSEMLEKKAISGGVEVMFDEELKEEFLQAHNDLRSKVANPQAANMQKLSWDEELFQVAEANVKDCVLRHTPFVERKTSSFQYTGENLYKGTDKELENIGKRVLSTWYGESKDFHLANKTCNKGRMCGHYTQVIWATTTKFGCAIAVCDGKEANEVNGILVCCTYGPMGNLFGEDDVMMDLYKPGTPCSQCDEGQDCENQLCYTPEATKPPSPTASKPDSTSASSVETTSVKLVSEITPSATPTSPAMTKSPTSNPTTETPDSKTPVVLANMPPPPPPDSKPADIPAVTTKSNVTTNETIPTDDAKTKAPSSTGANPVSTTSGERRVHSNKLAIFIFCSYVAGWLFRKF